MSKKNTTELSSPKERAKSRQSFDSKNTEYFVRPNNDEAETTERNVKLVVREFDIKRHDPYPFLFRFVKDQLQHVQTGKYAHPMHGRKGPGINIGLYEDTDGERTSCYPFDYDASRCLLAGGDNFFAKVNDKDELVWFKYWGTNDNGSPFSLGNRCLGNRFEFEISFHSSPKTDMPFMDANPLDLKYHEKCEYSQVKNRVCEFLFPLSYLVDEVEERIPYNGTKLNMFNKGFRNKTVAQDSVTQRMLLITAKVTTFEFGFAKNPWHKGSGCESQLLSFRLNESEVVSNYGESEESLQKLVIKLDKDHPYLDSLKVQCVLSLQNNPRNVKHICFLEVAAKNATATLNGEYLALTKGVWKIGKYLDPTNGEKDPTFDSKSCPMHVFKVEEEKGPLVFTGVGIDNYAGFVFQLARKGEESIDTFIDECFYDADEPRLTPADITHYNYFESFKKDQTGYKDVGQFSTLVTRNLFRELAVEDKQVAILFQKLNYLYPEFTTNPVFKVLPSMLDILERCFADNQIGLIQSVIRVSHIKSENSLINPPVREIWTTFSKTISMVKQFVLKRPNLNMIECAILQESWFDKLRALFVAVAQFLIAYILASHVLFPTTNDDDEGTANCDVQSILIDIWSHSMNKWHFCMLKCFWHVNFSFMMTIIAVVMSIFKVQKQIDDQSKFRNIFKTLVDSPSQTNYFNELLLICDYIVNVVLSNFTVLLTFLLISSADEVTDLVLNCLAITFIVELDEDLNYRDPVEINDLVVRSFKAYLIREMKRESESICVKHMEDKNGDIDEKFLLDQLDSAEYSSGRPKSEKVDVTEKVKEYIKVKKHLPILNESFKDPDPGCPKFLILRLKHNKEIRVREKHVLDFKVLENILKEGTTPQMLNPRSIYFENVLTSISTAVTMMVTKVLPSLTPSLRWVFSLMIELPKKISLGILEWLVTVSILIAVISCIHYVLEPISNQLMVPHEWLSSANESVITLTWPHDYFRPSKNELSDILLTLRIKHMCVRSFWIEVHGQKNSMVLVKEFGLLPATDDNYSNNISKCIGRAMMFSNKQWKDDEQLKKEVVYIGGCLIQSNRLVLKYDVKTVLNSIDLKACSRDEESTTVVMMK
eukprot:gene29662-38788_t